MIDELKLTCPNCGSSAENEQPEPGEYEFMTVFQCGSSIVIITEAEKRWEWIETCVAYPNDFSLKLEPFVVKFFDRLADDLNTLTAAPAKINMYSITVVTNSYITEKFINTQYNIIQFNDKKQKNNSGFFIFDIPTSIAITDLMMMFGMSTIIDKIEKNNFTAETYEGFTEVAHQIIGSLQQRILDKKLKHRKLELEHNTVSCTVNIHGLDSVISPCISIDNSYLLIGCSISVANFDARPFYFVLSKSLVNCIIGDSESTSISEGTKMSNTQIVPVEKSQPIVVENNTNSKQPTIVYAREEFLVVENSIFLAGPTPRDRETPSWRPGAINILNQLNFEGNILIPEDRVGFSDNFEYADQIEWEAAAMKSAKTIVFWVPRELKKMPAFTTNIEFGYWIATNPGKIIFGSPLNAPKMDYLRYYCKKLGIPHFYTLEETLIQATVRTK